jgi:hypothetical protein
MMWVTPLSDDKTRYFATVKKSGVPLDAFSYSYNDETFTSKHGESFLTIDSATSTPNYGMSYFFAVLQGKTSDGTNVGILLQDGIGSQYNGLERATEDSITLNGKVFKLDKTKLDYNRDDLMAKRRVHTSRGRFTNSRACDLTY